MTARELCRLTAGIRQREVANVKMWYVSVTWDGIGTPLMHEEHGPFGSEQEARKWWGRARHAGYPRGVVGKVFPQ